MSEQYSVFSEKQKQLLDATLDPRLVSSRKGGGNTTLKYVEGHDCIDSANRIFGYGNWSYRPLSCEQTVLIDPLTGEAVGIAYKAQVELMVRGCVGPIVEVGSQPVATWNVSDQIMSRRLADAKYNKTPVNESEFTPLEKSKARAAIVDAHETAEKGAVTDALKRALRTFGDQFGNGLYGDGRVSFPDEDEHQNGSPSHQKTSHTPAQPTPLRTTPDASQATAQPAQSPVNAATPALQKALDQAMQRALSLGVIENAAGWKPFLDEHGLGEVRSGADIAKINTTLTTVERKAG